MVPGNLRDRRRSATEAAILQAAWQRFASAGPDGTSIRDVAGDAGCNHTLVARYFGSKTGLIEAVGRRLDDRIDGAVHQARSDGGDAVLGLLTAARRDRASVQLLVRSGLGELGAAASPAARHVDAVLSGADGHGDPHEPRLRWCTYGAASLVLGWLTYEAFVVAATGLEAARQELGLSFPELWFRYFTVGGMSSATEVEAILYGALVASPSERDTIAVALNEGFAELGRDHPVPYTGDEPPPS